MTEIEGTDVSRDASGKMTVRFTNGTAKIKLKGDQTADIAELPDGDLYTAAETGDLPDGVTLTSPAKDAEGKQIISGTISSSDPAKVEFVNTYEEQKGSLSVKKTIVGARLTNDKTFKFTVVDKDGKYYYLEGTETKTSTDAKYVEVTVPAFGLTAESNVLNVPLGDYTVTEYTGTEYSEIKIADYSVKERNGYAECEEGAWRRRHMAGRKERGIHTGSSKRRADAYGSRRQHRDADS